MKIAIVFLALVATTFADETYIVGGETVEPGSIPWQAAILAFDHLYGWYHICGASVVGNKWVLTAAHCVTRYPNGYRVVVGGHLVGGQDGDWYEVKDAIINPGYDGLSYGGNGTFQDDVALLYLVRGIKNWQNYAIDLADSDAGDFAGETVYISGWGITEDWTVSSELRKTSGIVLSTEECQAIWGYYGAEVYDGHICVHNLDTGSCSGDSGGPMYIMLNGEWRLIGVTSWGSGWCAVYTELPSVYARVSYFRKWIAENSNQLSE